MSGNGSRIASARALDSSHRRMSQGRRSTAKPPGCNAEDRIFATRATAIGITFIRERGTTQRASTCRRLSTRSVRRYAPPTRCRPHVPGTVPPSHDPHRPHPPNHGSCFAVHAAPPGVWIVDPDDPPPAFTSALCIRRMTPEIDISDSMPRAGRRRCKHCRSFGEGLATDQEQPPAMEPGAPGPTSSALPACKRTRSSGF